MVWTTVVLRQRHFTQHLNRFIHALHSQVETNQELSYFPLQVFKVHQALSPISPMFSIAAAFGNVHGVYKVNFHLPNQVSSMKFKLCFNQAGNVVLSPKLLKGHQDFAKEQLKCSEEKPLYLVMHGGSGSSAAEIGEAVGGHFGFF